MFIIIVFRLGSDKLACSLFYSFGAVYWYEKWSSRIRTNGVVLSRGMGYEKCWEKESECSWDEVFEKFIWSVANG